MMAPTEPYALTTSDTKVQGIGAFSNVWFWDLDYGQKGRINEKACESKSRSSSKRKAKTAAKKTRKSRKGGRRR